MNIHCHPAQNGAMGLELVVPDADQVAGFNFGPFEGPDAPASEKALTHIHVGRKNGDTEATVTASGWYNWEGAFVFSVSQRSHRPGSLARLLSAMSSGGAQVRWTQASDGAASATIDATFKLDVAQLEKLRASVVECLPKNPRK